MGARQAEGVEGAGLDERLDHPPVDQPQIDAHAEVVERLERAVGRARLEDGLHGRLAHVLDGGQPKRTTSPATLKRTGRR
jgi:hypothetical protein